MNKLIFLIIFIFSSISLQAYSKNIVMAALDTEKRALGMIKGIPKESPSIYLLSKKYNFSFSVKKLGKYYLVLAGVFHNRKEIVIALKKVRKSYHGAYPAIATKIKEEVAVKKIKPIIVEVVDKNIRKVVVKKVQLKSKKQDIIVKEKVDIKSQIEKVEISKENTVVTKELKDIAKQETKEQKKKAESKIKEVESESSFHWSYIALLILFGIFIYYFIKFKRIYDEY